MLWAWDTLRINRWRQNVRCGEESHARRCAGDLLRDLQTLALSLPCSPPSSRASSSSLIVEKPPHRRSKSKRFKSLCMQVLSCEGSGSVSGILLGMDWAMRDSLDRGSPPTIFSMSLGKMRRSLMGSVPDLDFGSPLLHMLRRQWHPMAGVAPQHLPTPSHAHSL